MIANKTLKILIIDDDRFLLDMYLLKFKKSGLIDLINRSVNDTLSRTVLTSSTTIIALSALYFFGGKVIEDLALPMLVGIGTGTYSSIFVSSVLLLYFKPPRSDDYTPEAEVVGRG